MRLTQAVFCFLWLFCSDFVLSLNPSDEGVCVVKISSPRTRTKFYTVATKKMCGKKKCVIRKSKKETYTVQVNQTVCCKGWEYMNSEDRCSPHCSTGCQGGRCIAPDVCHCDPPAHLQHNTCITNCSCTNGICVQNSCQCNDGFIPYNSTLCVPKCSGHQHLDLTSLTCNCDCVNGNCTGSGCVCFEGYELTDNATCVPTCDNCDNGVCVGVNNCSCVEGYIMRDGVCVPHCDSCNDGLCVAPNNCDCREGFAKLGHGCEPICSEPCVNGVCSAPGVCSCVEGFQKNDSRSSVCFKPCNQCSAVCTVQGECVQDVACEKNTDDE